MKHWKVSEYNKLMNISRVFRKGVEYTREIIGVANKETSRKPVNFLGKLGIKYWKRWCNGCVNIKNEPILNLKI